MCAAITVIIVALWQLDLLCAPRFDWTRQIPKREILPFWWMHEADAYVMFLAWIGVGVALLFAALWFWGDSSSD